MKKSILFICTHNSARSQIAEGLVNSCFGQDWIAYSAGIIPTRVNPYAIQVMQEIGINISNQRSKSIDMFRDRKFDIVVTVCDSAKEACPFFPGKTVLHKGFVDPASFEGSEEEKLAVFRKVRAEIKNWLFATLPNNLSKNKQGE